MRSLLVDNNSVDLKSCSYGFPWDHEAHCFNFKAPNEFVMDTDIWKIANPEKVTALIIGCNLKDYSFISKMTNLRQLYIYAGENIVDLKFISELTNLNQLYLAESKIKEIDELVTLLRRQKEIAKNLEGINRIIYGFDAICVNSSEELEGSILLEQGFYVSEIIVNRKWIQR